MLLSSIGAHDDRIVRTSGDNGKPNAAVRDSAVVSKALKSDRSMESINCINYALPGFKPAVEALILLGTHYACRAPAESPFLKQQVSC